MPRRDGERPVNEAAGIVTERHGEYLIRRFADVPLEQVLDALRLVGLPLKTSRKSVTRRVGGWVVKESRRVLPVVLKHVFHPNRYRAGWRAALHLRAHGILVPRPRAFAECRRAGLVIGNAFIFDYLDGWVNVEDHARALIARQVSRETVDNFLQRLAQAVNGLNGTGAFHTDLSGKNIFTHDGTQFCFIDLDGVILDRTYTGPDRLLNHVQLYDSFCDGWEDEVLRPFLAHMLPPDRDCDAWLSEVRSAQAVRRARTEALWRRQGRRFA